MKIKVYSWRKDNYYYLEGEIIKETFDSSWESEIDYKTPEGSYSKRKFIINVQEHSLLYLGGR